RRSKQSRSFVYAPPKQFSTARLHFPQLDTPSAATEQRRAHLLFQLSNLQAEWWLTDAQPFGRRRDKDAIHTLGQPASEKRQGTKSREGIRVATPPAQIRTCGFPAY